MGRGKPSIGNAMDRREAEDLRWFSPTCAMSLVTDTFQHLVCCHITWRGCMTWDWSLYTWVMLVLLRRHSRQQTEWYEFKTVTHSTCNRFTVLNKVKGRRSCLIMASSAIVLAGYSMQPLRDHTKSSAHGQTFFSHKRSWLLNMESASVPLPTKYDKVGFHRTHFGCDKRGIWNLLDFWDIECWKKHSWEQYVMVAKKKLGQTPGYQYLPSVNIPSLQTMLILKNMNHNPDLS